MSIKDIPLNLNLSNESIGKKRPMAEGDMAEEIETINRRRSNSRSQGSSMPAAMSSRAREVLPKRQQFMYFVTLASLNETFVKKQLSVPFYPETRKLGRPAGAKIKPDVTNGYFDSRVLSRNHAAMFVEPASGKLMLKDLGSSNGTYVNEERIGSEAVEIKIGDTIYLGFNIQVDTNHKQISARVENINVVSSFLKSNASGEQPAVEGTAEHKHVSFIQGLFSQLSNVPQSEQGPKKATKDELSFDNALFGDINPTLEDSILGLHSKSRAGLFNNSQITNAAFLESLINTMSNDLVRVKQQNQTIISIEQHLVSYKRRLNEINKRYLDEELKSAARKYEDELTKERNHISKLKNEAKKHKEEYTSKVESLQKKLDKAQNEKRALQKKVDNLTKSPTDSGLGKSVSSSKHNEEPENQTSNISSDSLSLLNNIYSNGKSINHSSIKNQFNTKEHNQGNGNNTNNGNGNGHRSKESSQTSDSENSEKRLNSSLHSSNSNDQKENDGIHNTTSHTSRESDFSRSSSDLDQIDDPRHTNDRSFHNPSEISEFFKTNEPTPPVSDEEDNRERHSPRDEHNSSMEIEHSNEAHSHSNRTQRKRDKFNFPYSESQKIAVGVSIVLLGVILQRYVTYSI